MKKFIPFLFIFLMLTACNPKPQELVNSWQEALNKGDIDKTLSYLAEDATVTIIPAAEGDGIYSGRAEIRGWYETIRSGKGSGSLRNCKAEGDTITCVSTYADEGLKAMGVDFIEGSWVAVLRNGKIRSYTFTITPDSLAKFPPPPSVPVEALASSVDDLVGIWWFSPPGLKLEVKADGTSRLFFGAETIDQGNYTFDAGKVSWITSSYCKDKPATYEAYVTKRDDKPVSLRLKVVGSDPCPDRANTSKGIGKFVGP